jgi:RNA polymerase sigma-70 factor (ECF subfamily)
VPTLEGALEKAGPDRTDLEAERGIMSEQVRGALQSLSSDQRSAIELVYFHGLSSQEVGRILGVPAPTVRSRLRLGLLKLGGILQAQGLIAID